MKTMFKFLFISVALFAVTIKSQNLNAQETPPFNPADSLIQITLSAQEHSFIYSFMASRSGVDDLNYINQIAKKIVWDTTGKPVDTAQLVTVTVTYDQVARYYLAIGSNQERLTGYYNTIIKTDLFNQIYDKPALVGMILDIKNQSGTQTETLINLSYGLLYQIYKNMQFIGL